MVGVVAIEGPQTNRSVQGSGGSESESAVHPISVRSN